VTQKQKSVEVKMGHLFVKDYSHYLQRIVSYVGISTILHKTEIQFLFFRQPNQKSMPKSITGNLKFHSKNCRIIS